MSTDPNALVEVKASDLAALQRAKGLLGSLYADKDQGAAVRRALKKIDPSLQIPDEVAEQYAAPLRAENEELKKNLGELSKKFDDDRKSRQDEADLAKLTSSIDRAVSKHKLTEDGRAGLIKVMQERQIADADAAALVFKETLPKPQPTRAHTGPLPSAFNLLEVNTPKDKTDSEVQAFWDNPQKAADDVVKSILEEADEAA